MWRSAVGQRPGHREIGDLVRTTPADIREQPLQSMKDDQEQGPLLRSERIKVGGSNLVAYVTRSEVSITFEDAARALANQKAIDTYIPPNSESVSKSVRSAQKSKILIEPIIH